MSQVESMRGVTILTPRRRTTDPGRDGSPLPSLMGDEREGTCIPTLAKPGTETSPDIDVKEKLKDAFSRGWTVIVWNDPVNLMDYVVYVFKSVLKMNETDATRHMWEVHNHGKSQVARETKEKAELLVHRLRGFGLNTTMEQESR